jgi:ubiquinone/menaquinone biosynthesis C-methylase UbiE
MCADAPEDHWSRLEKPADVARAVERLTSIASAPSEQKARARFLDLLAARPGQLALEVGAGTGTIALELARRVAPTGRVVALDPSRPLLDVAASAAREAGLADVVEVQTGDARQLPYDNDRFDCAICHWVLLHVAEPERAVAEMQRVVKPGGSVMCVEVDWETAIVHPGETSVTRRILNASCDRHVDGWMGRRLLPLLRASGLAGVEVEPIVGIETGEHPAIFEFLHGRVPIAVAAGAISASVGEAWFAALEEARARGAFFFAVTQFAVWGRVAD